MSRTKNFNEVEDNYIRLNFNTLFDDEMAVELGRPEGSVKRRRQRLGCWYTQVEVSSSLKGEIWLPIRELPEGYYVSNMGRIRSGNKLMSLYVRDSGYIQGRVSNISKRVNKTYKVHRLVAEYFCEDYSESKDVHHIDFNPANNRWDNFMCLTKEEHRALHKAS